MRRVSGLLLAGALLLLPAFSQGDLSAAGQDAQKLSFNGDTALWMVAIKPDKTGDFEQLMKRVGEALQKLGRSQQAAGWKVVKGPVQPDGNVLYVHVISPVVADADYTVMQILYEANEDPAERTALYEQYRGAFAQNLLVSGYTTALRLGQ
ncbi:MAG: hypothetical protein FJW23_16025 [Acidimicrobiia bacterium]|nr:hypothetical protein [Acidimicrobiia bacterium]